MTMVCVCVIDKPRLKPLYLGRSAVRDQSRSPVPILASETHRRGGRAMREFQ